MSTTDFTTATGCRVRTYAIPAPPVAVEYPPGIYLRLSLDDATDMRTAELRMTREEATRLASDLMKAVAVHEELSRG